MSRSTIRAIATTTVRAYQAAAYDQPQQGPELNRIHVEEAFSGDLEAAGITELLLAAHADGSASFVGIERVDGALGGRRGTFLFQSIGTIRGNEVSAEWLVSPGSGTGELAGLRGKATLRARLGEGGTVHFDYEF